MRGFKYGPSYFLTSMNMQRLKLSISLNKTLVI